jgi:hypothetical protein
MRTHPYPYTGDLAFFFVLAASGSLALVLSGI